MSSITTTKVCHRTVIQTASLINISKPNVGVAQQKYCKITDRTKLGFYLNLQTWRCNHIQTPKRSALINWRLRKSPKTYLIEEPIQKVHQWGFIQDIFFHVLHTTFFPKIIPVYFTQENFQLRRTSNRLIGNVARNVMLKIRNFCGKLLLFLGYLTTFTSY